MIKCFITSGSAPGVSFCGEYVIAKDEAEAKEIIYKRYNTNDIEHFGCHEVSREEVRLVDLTAGDIMRIINANGGVA